MEKFKSVHLVCGCCGQGFPTWEGYEDRGSDAGYGTCLSCQKWQDAKAKKTMDEAIALVYAAVNEKNKKKINSYSRELQERMVLDLIDRGALQFKISK